MLSVIIPAYNEENMISVATSRISKILDDAKIPFQIIFVNDGSKDRTWDEIQKAAADLRVVGINFSRNFGKEAAMFAGLEYAEGDCSVVLDCDLQHPPEKIVEMYRLWENGCDVVEGIKEDRGSEGAAHRFASNTFYSVISRFMKEDLHNTSDFKLLDKKVVDTLNQMPERNTFFRALSYWVGFERGTVTYRVQERTAGKSKWSTWSLVKYAINNITSFSSMPLQIVTFLGFAMLAMAVVMGTVSLVQWFQGAAITGFTTVILLLLISSSLIMISLGIIGAYIAKIYNECKHRPRFIVSEICRAETPQEAE